MPGADDPQLCADRRGLEPGWQIHGVRPGGRQRALSARRRSMAELRQRSRRDADPVRPLSHSVQRGQGRRAGTDRRRFRQWHEQHLSQGLPRRPLDCFCEVPQRPVDASRQPVVHRAGARWQGAADALQQLPDEFLAQLFPQWTLAGLFLQSAFALTRRCI